MSRSMDLDTVAPDDMIENKKVEEKAVIKEVKEVKKVKVKKKVNVVEGGLLEDLNKKIYDVLGHTKHPFSSLLVNPHIFDFEERDSQEKIILVARPHWITNLSWILTAVALFIAPSLLKFVPLVGDIPAKFQMIGILAWYLVSFAFAFEKFLSWYFDVFIITDERIIDISFNNLLDKKFSEAKISMVQDVTSRVIGVIPTMFNYGTVFIQTAAEVAEIHFENVPNPEKIIKVLQILRDEEEREAIEGRVR